LHANTLLQVFRREIKIRTNQPYQKILMKEPSSNTVGARLSASYVHSLARPAQPKLKQEVMARIPFTRLVGRDVACNQRPRVGLPR